MFRWAGKNLMVQDCEIRINTGENNYFNDQSKQAKTLKYILYFGPQKNNLRSKIVKL